MNFQPSSQLKDSLSTLVLEEHTREHAEHIAHELVSDQELLATAVWLLRHGEAPIPQRVSWALEIASTECPGDFVSHANLLVDWLPILKHPSEFRNVTNILGRVPLPEDRLSELFELCLTWILDPKVMIATRANCMDIAYRIAENEPGLKREVTLAIREAMRHGSAAIKARGRQVLKKLEKKSKR